MQEIIKKINERLTPMGWYEQLRIFLESVDFLEIFIELKNKVDIDKQRFCPSFKGIFRPFEKCKFSNIKAVILVDHIDNRVEYNTGILFTNSIGHNCHVANCVLSSIPNRKNGTEDWLEQGVLIIPLAFTSRIEGKAHKKLWKPFLIRIIELINNTYPHVPWLLMGEDTYTYFEDIISENVKKVPLKNDFTADIWSTWINEVLTEQKKMTIEW